MKTFISHIFSKIKEAMRAQTSGFTLVESLVAVSILSMAVTGPLLIAQKGIGAAYYAKDQVIAFYLAQEAIEYIRNIRDTNRITDAAGGWLSSLGSCKDTGGGQRCTIDARFTDPTDPVAGVGAITACPTISGVIVACPLISFESETGLYGYNIGSATKFRRIISIDDRVDPKEAVVTVTITWNTNLFTPTRAFTIKEHMFNF